jgi:hypothetical protein
VKRGLSKRSVEYTQRGGVVKVDDMSCPIAILSYTSSTIQQVEDNHAKRYMIKEDRKRQPSWHCGLWSA